MGGRQGRCDDNVSFHNLLTQHAHSSFALRTNIDTDIHAHFDDDDNDGQDSIIFHHRPHHLGRHVDAMVFVLLRLQVRLLPVMQLSAVHDPLRPLLLRQPEDAHVAVLHPLPLLSALSLGAGQGPAAATAAARGRATARPSLDSVPHATALQRLGGGQRRDRGAAKDDAQGCRAVLDN